MNKNILLGFAFVGGLILVGSLFLGEAVDDEVEVGIDENLSTQSLPADFPNVPIYSNSKLETISDTAGEESRDFSLSLSTEDGVLEVNEWYQRELGQNGWVIKSDKNVGGYRIIQAENNNLYTSMQAARGSEEGVVNISQQVKVRQ